MLKKSLGYSFLCLPWFLFLGVAAQAFGLYFFALLIPILLLWRAQYLNFSFQNALRAGALFLVSLHLVFVVSNLIPFLSQIFATQTLILPLKWQVSRFSSAFLISGCVVLISSYLRAGASNQDNKIYDAPKMMSHFLMSILAASTAFFIYGLVQTKTGFDFKSPGHILLPEHRMVNGMYRIFGFYGHPLSLASVSLSFFAGFYFGFHKILSLLLYQNNNKDQKLKTATIAMALISLEHFILIILSGGRTAAVIAVLLLFTLPFFFHAKNTTQKQKFLFTSLIAAIVFLSVVAMYRLGIASRFSDAFQDFSTGAQQTDRFKFWKVHLSLFADHPFLGNGSAWLDAGIRTQKYLDLGYESLRDKFNAHNLFLETFACIGVFGVVFLIWSSWKFIKKLRFEIQNKPISKIYWQCFAAMVCANLAHGLTQNTLFDSNLALPLVSFFWMGFWLVAIEPKSEAALANH